MFKLPKGNRHGFTLIELMVVISIIAILATIGLVFYGQSQLLARDSKRKQDLREIATALETYKASTGAYPAANSWAYAGDGSSPWISGLTSTYIAALPSDPKSNTDSIPGSGKYGYWYWSGAISNLTCSGQTPNVQGNNQYYILVTNLENSSDGQTIDNQNLSPCIVNSLSYSSNSFIITSQ